MSSTAQSMDTAEESGHHPVGFALLGVLGTFSLCSQLAACCVWGAMALLGFNPFEEE